MLINAGKASKWELENAYTLDEALKLYALYRMDCDIEIYHAEQMKKSGKVRKH